MRQPRLESRDLEACESIDRRMTVRAFVSRTLWAGAETALVRTRLLVLPSRPHRRVVLALHVANAIVRAFGVSPWIASAASLVLSGVAPTARGLLVAVVQIGLVTKFDDTLSFVFLSGYFRKQHAAARARFEASDVLIISPSIGILVRLYTYLVTSTVPLFLTVSESQSSAADIASTRLKWPAADESMSASARSASSQPHSPNLPSDRMRPWSRRTAAC